jgi:hypothetical protein
MGRHIGLAGTIFLVELTQTRWVMRADRALSGKGSAYWLAGTDFFTPPDDLFHFI